MKVISPIFSSMRGKLGGAVGAVSRGGVAYLRSLIIPGNPRNVFQTTVRLILTSLAAGWANTLTDVQRAGWTTISPPESSGIDSYVKGNAQPVLAGFSPQNDAPDSLALVATPILTVVVDASSHTITVTPVVEAEVAMNVYASAPQRSSRLSQQHQTTFVDSIAATTGVTTVPVGHPAYNLVAGDIVYVRVVKFGYDVGASGEPSGQVATEQVFRCVVAA